jgi:hypothetical protein
MSSIVRYVRFDPSCRMPVAPLRPALLCVCLNGAAIADTGAISIGVLLSQDFMLIYTSSAVMFGALLRHSWSDPTDGDRGPVS